MVKDVVKHGLQECPELTGQRRIFRIVMRFYNAPKELDFKNKVAVFEAALGKKSILKVVCDFLLKIWAWKGN